MGLVGPYRLDALEEVPVKKSTDSHLLAVKAKTRFFEPHHADIIGKVATGALALYVATKTVDSPQICYTREDGTLCRTCPKTDIIFNQGEESKKQLYNELEQHVEQVIDSDSKLPSIEPIDPGITKDESLVIQSFYQLLENLTFS